MWYGYLDFFPTVESNLLAILSSVLCNFRSRFVHPKVNWSVRPSVLIHFIILFYSIQLFLIFGRPCHFTLCHTVTAAGPSKLHPRQESVNWSTWQATALSGDEAVERTQRRSAVLGHCSPPVLQQTQLSTDVSVSGWRYCYVRDNIYCVIIFVWNILWRHRSKSIWDNGILKRNFLKDKRDAFYNV